MPVEFIGERERCIFDVQDATMPRACGTAGGVEQQRTHEQGITSGGGAEKVGLLAAQLLDTAGCEAAKAMRTRQDTQGSVGCIGVVEVQSDGEHLLEESGGWLNVGNAILRAPRTEASHLGPGTECQRQILVPRNQPIRIRGLVEVDGADGEGFSRQMSANEVEKPR